jgi:hypothetical protein
VIGRVVLVLCTLSAVARSEGRRPNDLARPVFVCGGVIRDDPPTPTPRLGLGLFVGADTDEGTIYGGHMIANLVDVGPGVIRGLAQLLYSSRPFGYTAKKWLYAPSLAVEYCHTCTQLGLVGGAGVEIDVESQTSSPRHTASRFALHAGPTFPVGPVVLNLSFQLVFGGERSALLGVDYFTW